MMFFSLNNDERGRLERLNQDQSTVFALKKLFLNTMSGAKGYDVQYLGAERIAQEYVKRSLVS